MSMTPNPTLKQVQELILKLPIAEQIVLLEDLEERLETVIMMNLAETGFQEWNEPEEDIYTNQLLVQS
ncbi:hypothetical protein [Limnoraphis robusta]|uniref:Uncharacterized protein n=1 Tax=Limnoraphis robusta CCNP1315 TaxID=3110306 RepID=A0ABU5U4N5_9CYAN|nr:hypothetical protein [Limnoraphis robusta]MEA5521970.1 hypothetical protein [Limnoraphis robusta CCNP1315]MEA5545731.1 hypothetical protein [Limnoraphis robusta CCNP1324]